MLYKATGRQWFRAHQRSPVGCRYRLGSSGTAKALTLFREGWSALPIFAPIDRAAVMIVGASMIPYNPPKRQHVRPLHSPFALSSTTKAGLTSWLGVRASSGISRGFYLHIDPWQAIRPDEESSLPVGLPEDKGGRQKAQEDNEENAGEPVTCRCIASAHIVESHVC